MAREDRFRALYRILGGVRDAEERARDLCLEQTVELPLHVIPLGFIRDQVIGRVESLRKHTTGYHAVISYPIRSVGKELPQLLNVLFGNTSIKPGIRLERLDLPPSMLRQFKGPRFGARGLRQHLQVARRPLLCAVLKPMGLAAEALADLAYRCALGGIDIIKDDHGLADQPYARFETRVKQCARAVAKANRETGFHCVYAPNITAPHEELLVRARFARQAGGGAVLVCPGLTGLDGMRSVADDAQVALPVLSHPAFQGSFVLHPDSGISHFALFGQIARLAGADVSIYPNFGGRFSFSEGECRSIVEGCQVPMGPIRPILPSPGGGMPLDRVPDLLRFYGNDVILLVGGGLLAHGPDVVENSRVFRRMVGG